MSIRIDENGTTLYQLASINLVTDTGNVAETLTVWVPDPKITRSYAKVVATGHGPNEYQQHWTYRGDDARIQAMNKMLSSMGFGTLEGTSDA